MAFRAQLQKYYVSVDTIEFEIVCDLGNKRKKGGIQKGEREIGYYLPPYLDLSGASGWCLHSYTASLQHAAYFSLLFWGVREIISCSILISEALRAQNVVGHVTTVQDFKRS